MAGVIIGVDEAGRGPWAGPLVAAAVALPSRSRIHGVKDSKLLKSDKRQELALKIRSRAIDVGIGWVSHTEIDKYGLTWANRTAMLRALKQIKVQSTQIIIDGKFNYLAKHYKHAQAIIRADGSVPAVSAASIIAKVTRDNYMISLARQFPQYGFENHVGYGTAAHVQAVAEFGPCELHRVRFAPVWQATQTNIWANVD